MAVHGGARLMVGPVSQGERDSFNRKLRVGVAALVAVSTGMVALGAGASLPQAGAALLGGVAVGALIAWYIVPSGTAPATRRAVGRDRFDDPFADGGESDDAGHEGADGRGRAPSSGGRRREK
ncbi:MAG: hypothetical protein V5A28_05220 [Haloarculaceae archaeon]